MAPEKAPAFQFYPRDWDTDVHVIPMTFEEEGVYFAIIRLLWNHKTAPADLDELRLLLKGNPSLEQMNVWWKKIGKCFTERGGVLRQKRVEKERRKQATRRKTQRLNGLKGGRPKATGLPITTQQETHGKALHLPSSSSPAGSKNNPQPPQAGAVRILRSDRKHAERIREHSRDGCQHEPRCEGYVVCVERIALGLAQQRAEVRKAS